MKNIKFLFLSLVVLTGISCNNQPASEATELAVPVSVQNIRK